MRLTKVTRVTAGENFALDLTFDDGTSGTAHLADDLTGALAGLRDPELWRQARVVRGVVSWGDAFDVAPEFLYARVHGLPVPGSAEEVEANRLAVTLRELRTLAGKTQEQVAEAMGVAQAEVSRLEGRTDSKLSTLERYVRALGGEVEIVARFGDRSLRVHLA